MNTQEQFEFIKNKLEGKSLMIATPLFGGMCHGAFAESISQLLLLCQKIGIEAKTSTLSGDSLINRARSYLLQTFLDSEYSHIIWIDADIVFNPYDVITMLAYCGSKHPINGITMDIVGGLYSKKSLSADKMCAAVKAGLCEENPEDIFKYSADLVVNPISNGNIDINKPFEISELGTGFMMTSKEKVNEIRRAHPELKYFPDHVRTKGFDGSRPIYNLFEVRIDDDRLKSEDYMYCKLARDVGQHIFAFPWVKLVHIGTHFYTGDFSSLAVLANEIKDEYIFSLSGPLVKKEMPKS